MNVMKINNKFIQYKLQRIGRTKTFTKNIISKLIVTNLFSYLFSYFHSLIYLRKENNLES